LHFYNDLIFARDGGSSQFFFLFFKCIVKKFNHLNFFLISLYNNIKKFTIFRDILKFKERQKVVEERELILKKRSWVIYDIARAEYIQVKNHKKDLRSKIAQVSHVEGGRQKKKFIWLICSKSANVLGSLLILLGQVAYNYSDNKL
jgi:hypothetical protein